jgi:hypothetical protein
MAMNNIIVLNRGDTYEFDLTINDETSTDGRYRLKENDALYLGIMDPGQPFEIALIRKKVTVEDTDTMGNINLVLNPEDTLDLLPGKYFYSVKLHLDHYEYDPETKEIIGQVDKVVTIINKTKFILCD